MKTVNIKGLKIGTDYPVRFMGVINLSPESFYDGSIKTGKGSILQTAIRQIKSGADIIDIGAKSTAPYLETEISAEEETNRALTGLEIIKPEINQPISIDTVRSSVAKAALENGADLINDISGFHDDKKMADIAVEFNVPVILGATQLNRFSGTPIERVIEALKQSINIAQNAGVKEENIIIDPDIGFHRIKDFKWYKIDSHILVNIQEMIKTFDLPVCIGLSRKSFIGKILDLKDPKERLYGSLGATSIAILNGANIIRTHDVKQTVESVRVIEKILSYARDFEK